MYCNKIDMFEVLIFNLLSGSLKFFAVIIVSSYIWSICLFFDKMKILWRCSRLRTRSRRTRMPLQQSARSKFLRLCLIWRTPTRSWRASWKIFTSTKLCMFLHFVVFLPRRLHWANLIFIIAVTWTSLETVRLLWSTSHSDWGKLSARFIPVSLESLRRSLVERY